MTSTENQKQKTKRDIFPWICLVIVGCVIVASVLSVVVDIQQSDHTTPNPQSVVVGNFTLHATYKQFDGGIQEIEGRVVDVGEHGGPNTYLWVVLVQGKGDTAYFQIGYKPIPPTREQMCLDGLEYDGCKQDMILNKLNVTGSSQ